MKQMLITKFKMNNSELGKTLKIFTVSQKKGGEND